MAEAAEFDIPYQSPLIGNIRQALAGLQGYDAMALEIIQNADDAAATNVVFDVRDDKLFIRNDAPFTSCGMKTEDCPWHEEEGRRCDFHAISMVGSSNKYDEASLIGRFGIGFVSVYQITDKPIIRSGSVQLTLDPAKARNAVETIPEITGSEFELPYAVNEESSVRSGLRLSAVESDITSHILEAVTSVTDRCIIFLRHIVKIDILNNGTTVRRTVLNRKKDGRVHITSEPEKGEEDWFVMSASGAHLTKPLKEKYRPLRQLNRQEDVQIAFQLDGGPLNRGRLYAYLPTEQPSGLPCHINGDFFPEQDRRAVILSGEQHYRYWNETLLETAAEAIAGRLSELKNILSKEQLWSLISAAAECAETNGWNMYWNYIGTAASSEASIFTSDGSWARPADAVFPPFDVTPAETDVLESLGFDLVHSELRGYGAVMLRVGVETLDIDHVLQTLEERQEAQSRGTVPEGIERDALWSLLEKLYGEEKEDAEDSAERLAELEIVLDSEGECNSISDLYRLPEGVDVKDIKYFFPEIPIVTERFKNYENIYKLIDVLTLSSLCEEIAEIISNEEQAQIHIGVSENDHRRFYRMLATYPDDDPEASISDILANTPLLAVGQRFIDPERAFFPGGFRDPIGDLDILDPDLFDARSREFLEQRLGVASLTFESYLTDHLDRIIRNGLTPEQYQALISVLTHKYNRIEREDIRDKLSDLPFVLTASGDFARPKNLYIWSEELEQVIGRKPERLLSEDELPEECRDYARTLIERLGCRRDPSAADIIGRVREITEGPPTKDARAAIARVFLYVSERFARWQKDSEALEDFEELQVEEWLPATIDGEYDEENWYAPNEIYQNFRASGFSSQVPVLALRSTHQAPLTREFLEFLGMPAEPDTKTIVDHLLHRMSDGLPANDTVYAILNERLQNDDDVSEVDRLRGTACIYAGPQEGYLRPENVFWSRPHLGRFCVRASDRMRNQALLFSRLGVKEEPDVETFVQVLEDIAERYGGLERIEDNEVVEINNHCINMLAERLFENPDFLGDALRRLSAVPSIVSDAGGLAFPEEIAIRDSEWCAEPFHGELDARLVTSPASWRRLLDDLGVPLLSEVVEHEAVRIGKCSFKEEATRTVRSRTDLFEWVLSMIDRRTRRAGLNALKDIEIYSTDALRARAKFVRAEPPIVSSPGDVLSFFDKEENVLYIRSDSRKSMWMTGLKAFFFTMFSADEFIDIKQIVYICATLCKAPSPEEAKSELTEAGFHPPEDDEPDGGVDLGSGELGDFPQADDEEPYDSDEGRTVDETEDQADDETDEADPENGPSVGEEADDEQSEAEEGEKGNAAGAGGDRAGQRKSSGGSESAGNSGTSAAGSGRANKRSEWMRSYVYPRTGGDTQHDQNDGSREERIDSIDEAAMRAVLEYERNRGVEPERMPHHNPGFDIKSDDPTTGTRRLIEVKGLDDEWTARGVKLTRMQIMNAEEYGDEYWVYVVEFARDDQKRQVHAIQNPFFKASEFWFDYIWREVADETGGDLRSRFVPGKKVHVDNWGEGHVIKRQEHGRDLKLVIDFQMHGRRMLPFDANAMRLIEG